MEALSNFKYAFAVILFVLISCSKGDTADIYNDSFSGSRNLSINATISSNTKTSLNDLKVSWSKEDEIAVFTSSTNIPSGLTLESGEGSSSAVFTGNVAGYPEIAKYPYKTNDKYTDGIISTEISDQQEYIPLTFADGVSPMAALADNKGNYSFSNLCSVLRLTLTGSNELEKIIVTTEDENCYLAGQAKIKLEDGLPVLNVEDGSQSIHLNCNGVLLSPVIRSTFLIVIPSQVYESGILIEVYTKLGKISKHTGKIDLKKSTLYDIEPFEVKINGGVNPSPFLKGNGVQSSPYIVSSLEDLLHIQNAMAESGNITNEDGNPGKPAQSAWYTLTEDIDLSPCCGPELGSWKTLTIKKDYFRGHFDGNGHKITGLYAKDTEGKSNFFGDIYQGGYLGNLEVVGNVTTGDASIVCGTVYGTVENCTSRGYVAGYNSVGGVVSNLYSGGSVINCKNYADIESYCTIYNSIGGVVAYSTGNVIDNCINYGKINITTGSCRVGGVIGHMESTVINCMNYGEITGPYHTGGICGDCYNSEIVNCVNFGKIHGTNPGTTLCGGICGELSDPFSSSIACIKNCINVGSVDGGKNNCAICGTNERITQYCYWLNTIATGVKGGSQLGLTSLSTAQMKGESTCPSLYSGYTSTVNALNGFAFDNSNADRKYQGWMYDSQTGWPILTGRPALPPGQMDKFIKTNPTSIILNTYAQSIELSITSSAEVSLTLPDWMTQKNLKTEQNGPIKYSTYALDVQQNKSGAQRTGTIMVQSTDECTAYVEVTQRYTYISEDYSRDGNVITLQKATKGNGIDIVLMGDAYTDADIKSGKYESDIKRGVEGFFSIEPYASFRELFNIYYVELISESNEIGSSTALETYFGSGTLVGGNDTKVRSLCSFVTNKTNLDDVTAIVIINTPRYAGTCYMYYAYSGNHGLGFSVSYFPLGTSSTGQTSMEALIRHEAGGHGFGKLADEYSYQSQGRIPSSEVNNHRSLQNYGWWLNIDFTSDPFAVLWSKYIQDNRYAAERIDIYEGGATYWSGVWRPTENSIMRYNTGQYNAPSREAIYYKIHRLAYGSSWTYDHETFVEYDAVNRSAAALSAGRLSDNEKAAFRPTHPPIIVR